MFAPHFDRHVWIYRDNPNGVFAPFNPSVSCVNHRETHGHAGEWMQRTERYQVSGVRRGPGPRPRLTPVP